MVALLASSRTPVFVSYSHANGDDMAARTPQVHEIDISKHAKAFNFATTASYVVAYGCVSFIMYTIFLCVVIPSPYPEPVCVISLLCAPFFGFCAITTYQAASKIDDAAFRQMYRVHSVLVAALFLIVPFTGGIELLSFSFICAIVALLFAWLRRSPLPAVHFSASDLATRLRDGELARLVESIGWTKINRANPALAIALILLGLLGLFLQSMAATGVLYFVLPELDLPYFVGRTAVTIAPLSGIVGFALLLSARRHLQISADAMLSVDSRAPIVFLRAFEDDERPDYRQSQEALVDFSLETRLAEHVRYVGPFVAVGCPTDRVPLLGALRAKLADSEWQGHVIDWISKASIIIMYAGKTRWVNWELSKVIEKERAESMILIMPEKKRERGVYGYLSGRPKEEDMALRIDRIKEAFASTKWRSVLTEIRDMQGIRVLLFEGDGSVAVIRSRSGTRGAYHLAALVGLYIVRKHLSLNTSCRWER